MTGLKKAYVKFRSKAFGPTERIKTLELTLDAMRDEQGRYFRKLEELQYKTMKYDATGVIQLSEKEIATKIFNDLIMYLDPRDLAVVPHIVFERIWEREITYAWLSVLNKPDAIVIDIGANFGYYGMLAAQRLDKSAGKVYFFEPNPDLLYYLHKTLSVNWLNENTVVENLGVGDKPGMVQLNVLEDYVGSSSMQSIDQLREYLADQMSLKTERAIDVPVVTLDDYCKTNDIKEVHFIKMDIEGYEEHAYKGMASIVKKSPELVLFIEFTKGAYSKPAQFYDRLQKDFEYIYTIGPDGSLQVPSDASYKAVVEPAGILVFLVFSKRGLV